MPTPRLSDQLAQEALNLMELYGNAHAAKQALGDECPPRQTMNNRAEQARLRGMVPTVKKDATRIYTRQRLGKMFLVIPDVQMKAGLSQDHLEWIGNFIVEKKPDEIICIGDFADMSSLSSHDKGKLEFEGRRYIKDITAVHSAMERLTKPIHDYNRTAPKGEKYKPNMTMCLGNHENRIIRLVNDNPEYLGKFCIEDLRYPDFGWDVHGFLNVVEIGGVEFSHYFTSGVMGRAAPSAAVMLRERQKSCVAGHVQTFSIAVHPKTQNIAIQGGVCNLHDEAYLGPQGNHLRRQILVMHEVSNGMFDPMLVSLNFLSKAYN